MKKILFAIMLITLFFLSSIVFFMPKNASVSRNIAQMISPSPLASPTPTRAPLPEKKVLANDYHIFQSFNNCGPASLSMTLSYYGIKESQETLGQQLRPYQIPEGDNDDKSVTLTELARKAEEFGLVAYHRPNGSIEILKEAIANDMPVLTRTWLELNEDIGHYRVVKGYDDTTQTLIQDDSLQGKNLSYSYDTFLQLWKKFNFEYVILIPKEKQVIAQQILGEDVNEKTAWEKALHNAEVEVKNNPDDIYAQFNVSVAAYHTGDFKKSVQAFEAVETALPWRTLWYQLEPVQAYFALGEYDRVFSLTDAMLNNQNRAYSESYLLRGKIYQKQGNTEATRQEFENAVFYNKNLKEAQEALNTL